MKRTRLVALVLAFLARLRFRSLFLLVAVLFLLDLFIPDAVPFADEVLLGLAALLLAKMKKPQTTESG